MLISFLFLNKNICCGYSLEGPQWGASNEYPQHMFSLRIKKNIMWIPSLICSYAQADLDSSFTYVGRIRENIAFFVALDKRGYQDNNFLISPWKHMLRYSLEVPHWGTSNEYHYIFMVKNTDNPLNTNTRYNDKISHNGNMTDTKPSLKR